MSFSHVNGASTGTTPGDVTSLSYTTSWSVQTGDLLIVAACLLQPGSNTYSVSDASGKNTWTPGPLVGSGLPESQLFWTVVQPGGGGNLAITLHSTGDDYLSIAVDEYSFAAGATIAAATPATAFGSWSGGAISSGNCSFSGAGNWLLYGEWIFSSTSPGDYPVASGSWTQRQGIAGSAGNYFTVGTGDQLNLSSSSSPIAATATFAGAAAQYGAQCWAFHEVSGPTFTVSPTIANANSAVSVTATGTNTSWTSSTTFSVSGGSGASISGLSVNTGTQVATFTLHTGTAAGTLTISDSTDSATATAHVSLSFSLSPAGGALNSAIPVTATGTGTAWTSGTTFSLSGVSGTSITGFSVNAATQVATFTLNTGSTSGTLTVSDSTDSATATFGVATSFQFVQNGGTSNSTNSSTITITKTVTAGHLVRLDLVAFCSSGAVQNQQWKITDNSGANNVWIQAAHGEIFGSATTADIAESWYAIMGSSGSVTFTATAPTSGAYQTLGFTEWSIAGGNWVTIVPGSQLTSYAAGTTTPTLGTMSVLQPGDLAFGNMFLGGSNGTTVSAGTPGFTLEYSQTESPGLTCFGCLDMVATSTAPQTIYLTTSVSSGAIVFVGAALRVVTLPAIPASFTVQYESDSTVYSDSGITSIAPGGTVQQWNDMTGNYNLSAGSKPTWAVTNNCANGLPGVQFTGSSSQYLLDSYTGERGTVIAVYQNSLTDGAYGIMGADSNDNNTVGAYYMLSAQAWNLSSAPLGPATWARATEADTALPLALQGKMTPTWNLATIQGGRTDTTGGSLQSRLYEGKILMQASTSASSVRPIKAGTSVVGCTRDSLANSNYFTGTLYALYESPNDVSDADFVQAVNRLSIKYGIPQQLALSPPTTYVGAFFQNPQSGVNNGSGPEGPATDRMYIVQSPDGVNLTCFPSAFQTTTGNNAQKDCDLIYYGGQYLMAYTAIGGFDQATPFFGLASSPDLINWTLLYDVPFSGLFFVICPHLAIDPTTGLLHAFFAANPSTSTFAGVQIYETHPTTPGVLTAWSSPTLVIPVGNYGPGSGACDPFYVYDSSYSSGAGPHQLWYAAEGTLRSVQVASCATINGTYTDTKTGNWAAWTLPSGTTQEMEGPFLRQLPSGLWQIWFDGGVLSTVANYGYWTTTSTTTDPLGTWNTACQPVNGPFANLGRVQHGRMIAMPAAGSASQANGAGGGPNYAF